MEHVPGVNIISHSIDNFLEYMRLQIGFALGAR